MTETVLLRTGMKLLIDNLGLVEAERFVVLLNREPFDYTKFHSTLFEGMSFEEILQEAAKAKEAADKRNEISAVSNAE